MGDWYQAELITSVPAQTNGVSELGKSDDLQGIYAGSAHR
jgi:hypothetical protein